MPTYMPMYMYMHMAYMGVYLFVLVFPLVCGKPSAASSAARWMGATEKIGVPTETAGATGVTTATVVTDVAGAASVMAAAGA